MQVIIGNTFIPLDSTLMVPGSIHLSIEIASQIQKKKPFEYALITGSNSETLQSLSRFKYHDSIPLSIGIADRFPSLFKITLDHALNFSTLETYVHSGTLFIKKKNFYSHHVNCIVQESLNDTHSQSWRSIGRGAKRLEILHKRSLNLV